MRTDTKSRDDVQDSEIIILRQRMGDTESLENKIVETLNAFKNKFSEHVDVNNKNVDVVREFIRSQSDNQKELHNLINKTNKRLDRQSYALCLLFGIVIGLLAKVYFFS